MWEQSREGSTPFIRTKSTSMKQETIESLIGTPLYLRYENEITFPPCKPSHYHADINGEILIGDEIKIGTCAFWSVRLDLNRCPFSVWDLLDGPSSETADLLSLVTNGDVMDGPRLNFYGKGDFYTPETMKVIREEPMDKEVLLLTRMDIQEKWRGSGIGLAVATAIMETFAPSRGIAVCKPFPLQYESVVDKSNHQEFIAAEKKLRKYWSLLGFKLVRGTNLMVMNRERKSPQLTTVLAKLKREGKLRTITDAEVDAAGLDGGTDVIH